MNKNAIARYAVSIFVAYVAFVVFNRWYFTPDKISCVDCFFRYGVPFAYFHEGGFAGGAGYIWSGVSGDGFIVIVAGIVIARIWGRFPRESSQQISTYRER